MQKIGVKHKLFLMIALSFYWLFVRVVFMSSLILLIQKGSPDGLSASNYSVLHPGRRRKDQPFQIYTLVMRLAPKQNMYQVHSA